MVLSELPLPLYDSVIKKHKTTEMSHFAIAGLQLSLKNGNNLAVIMDQIRKVKARFPWVQMVVLSELATWGTDPATARPIHNEAIDAYREVANSLDIWLVPGSLYEQSDDRIYNTAPVINGSGELVACYRKIYPFSPYENGITAGNDFVVFDVPEVGRFGVSICYDKWFPETTRALAWLGAEVIIHPNLTTTIDRDVELAMTRSNAASNQCYFFDVNTAAPFGAGRSIVCGPGGEVIHQAGQAEEMFPIEIDLAYLRRVRERGWQGLGQTLKSFRDIKVDYPQHQSTSSDYLQSLGELEIPGKVEL